MKMLNLANMGENAELDGRNTKYGILNNTKSGIEYN